MTLKGFKSFPDRTKLEFGPGVNVIVGPNGAGKSNITEAVLWCLGEQSPLTLRGQTMQDVIFAGGYSVSSRRCAEVEVVLDNSDGRVPIEFSEVSLQRRLDRSGDSEYRLNGARCRLIDMVELLSDTNLGKEMHSFVSQGAVEEIVHSKPHERRLLIEEAAGLGKHRKRRRRAQLKLKRTEDNLDRVLDVEREARTRLRPLKRQAEAAEHHRRLERQALELRSTIVAGDLRAVRAELGAVEHEAGLACRERDQLELRLAEVARQRRSAEERLAERGKERELLTKAYFGAQAAAESVAVRVEQAQELACNIADRAHHARLAEEAEAARRAQLQLRNQGTECDEQSNPPAPVEGARRMLDEIELSGKWAELARLLLDDVWVVRDVNDLPSDFGGTAITAHGEAFFGSESGVYQLAPGGEREPVHEAGRHLGDLGAERRRLEQLGHKAEALADNLKLAVGALELRRDKLEAEFEASRDQGTETTHELRELAARENAIQAELRQANEAVTKREVSAAQIRDRESEVATELEEIATKLGLKLSAADQTLEDSERVELESKLERLARRREQLGPVNPLARAEYEEALDHVQELKAQRSDLESALKELKELIRDADRQIRERFEQTLTETARNFEEVVGSLFPGGRGRIRLIKPQGPRPLLGGADDLDADAEVRSEQEDWGVEVEVTPAGKAMRRLSLLSGGEKSLVALAFLFAVFLARPCPFYILDEVEAALDDINIDRFLRLIRRYSERAQFIIVTHQRRTLDAADALYGVSMADDGISKVVSRKLSGKMPDLDLAGAKAA